MVHAPVRRPRFLENPCGNKGRILLAPHKERRDLDGGEPLNRIRRSVIAEMPLNRISVIRPYAVFKSRSHDFISH